MNIVEFTPRQKENFNYFLKKFGQPFAARPVDEETLNKYQGVLPDLLLKYWQTYGFCGFGNGLMWMTNPDDYEDLLDAWLPEEVLAGKKHFVIARTAWGELSVWEPTYGHKYSINAIHGYIYLEENREKEMSEGKADDELEDVFVFEDPDYVRTILDDISYFDYATEKFGVLKENEMFTFVPAVFMGGKMGVEQIRKVDLFIQMDILAQMAEPKIITLEDLRKMGWGI